MKRSYLITALAVGLLLFAAASHSRQEAAKKKTAGEAADAKMLKQTICPVMGGEIDTTIFVDRQGQRVYFCCAACIDMFEKDPDKYFEKAAEEGILFENVQTVCPVTGNPVDKRYFLDYKGRRIYFCCEGCTKSFLEDPVGYLIKLGEKTDESMDKKKQGHGREHKHGHEHDHQH